MTKDDIQHPFSSIPLGSVFRHECAMFMKMCDATAASFHQLENGSAAFEPAIEFEPDQVVAMVEDVWLAL
jgi:hypothetical protein